MVACASFLLGGREDGAVKPGKDEGSLHVFGPSELLCPFLNGVMKHTLRLLNAMNSTMPLTPTNLHSTWLKSKGFFKELGDIKASFIFVYMRYRCKVTFSFGGLRHLAFRLDPV